MVGAGVPYAEPRPQRRFHPAPPGLGVAVAGRPWRFGRRCGPYLPTIESMSMSYATDRALWQARQRRRRAEADRFAVAPLLMVAALLIPAAALVIAAGVLGLS